MSAFISPSAVAAMRNKLAAYQTSVITRTKEAVAIEIAGVGMQSQADVPKLSGDLAGSMTISEMRNINHVLSVQISYGDGGRVVYAAKVHEDLDAQHPHGGSAKYLERPLNAAAVGMADRIAEYVKG